MSDWPDDISKEAWSVGCETWEKLEREHPAFDAEIAVIARAIDQARREGYAAGVMAAAEVVESRPGFGRLIGVTTWHSIKQIAAAIRALDVKWGGE